MSKRDFDQWLKTCCESIATYDYYVDFKKVFENVESIKVELNILNSLIGSKNIENEFESILNKYPETLKCIPILLAVREKEIFGGEEGGEVYKYSFNSFNCSIDDYKVFMRKTGLFDLLEHHIINNLFDYATGVETGLDSNGRKNRGGDLMENLIESFIIQSGFVKGETYFKELNASYINNKWNIDLSTVLNKGKSEKRFDFVVKTKNCIYGIETNFYTGGGSKLNAIAQEYTKRAQETKKINGFKFVWFTDGLNGWKTAKNDLRETFENLEDLYNINDCRNGIMKELFV